MLFIVSSELARLLDISERRVNQIAKEGVIFKRDPNGKFDAPLCIEGFYKSKFIPNEQVMSFDREKTLHEKAKREKAELELARMKGELHESKDIEMVMTGMLVTFRNRILGIPSKLSPLLLGVNSLNRINALLDTELRSALSELSEYDPGMFAGDEVVTEQETFFFSTDNKVFMKGGC